MVGTVNGGPVPLARASPDHTVGTRTCAIRRCTIGMVDSQDGCGSGAGEFLTDGPGEAEELGDGVWDGVSVGEAAPGEEALSRGEGDGLARMSSHAQSSPVYPPISFSRAAQRSWSFCKSGGPGGSSAEPGKTIYVIFRSLAGRL